VGRQVARLAGWATENGTAVGEVVAEVGSGMDGERRKLAEVLASPTATALLAGHRGRAARSGVEHLGAALPAQGGKIVVVGPGELEHDSVRDMTEVLASPCARPYGRRGARDRAEKALCCAGQAKPLQPRGKL
jgi:putative resolvase